MDYQKMKEKFLENPDKPFFLTKNFTIQELTKTQHRELLQKNIMSAIESEHVFTNLFNLCVKLLQPLRNIVGAINVTSGYRCPELNKLVGSNDKSQHLLGEAVDFVLVKSIPVLDQFKLVYQTIQNLKLPYGQIIYEFGWIHLSIENKERSIVKQPPLQYKNGKYERITL